MARRSDNTRKELKEMAIEAALALLEESGIGALSTRQIATRIGYTVGTLYNLFDDFEDIVLHLNAATLRDMYVVLAPRARSKKKPHQRILDIAHAYGDYAHAHPARWNLLHSAPRSTALPAWFHTDVQAMFTMVEAPLQELPGITPQASRDAARVLWAGLHGICALGINQKLVRVAAGPTHELIDNFVGHYLDGLAGSPLSSTPPKAR